MFSCAYSKRARAVCVWGSYRDMPVFMPHEIIHVAYPNSDKFTDPLDEHESGMIAYEIAWLNRCCERLELDHGTTEALMKVWRRYAADGDPIALFSSDQDILSSFRSDEYRPSAEMELKIHKKLPDPWRR